MRKIRKRIPSPAMIVACLALTIALKDNRYCLAAVFSCHSNHIGCCGDLLTINFNNNGWGAEIQALTFSRNMANYRNGNLWGTSDQAWWWQEVEAQSLPLWEDGSVRWIGWGPMDMAPELLASFALETFRRGGCLVQIEPPATLFE